MSVYETNSLRADRRTVTSNEAPYKSRRGLSRDGEENPRHEGNNIAFGALFIPSISPEAKGSQLKRQHEGIVGRGLRYCVELVSYPQKPS